MTGEPAIANGDKDGHIHEIFIGRTFSLDAESFFFRDAFSFISFC